MRTPTPGEYDLAHDICRLATRYKNEGRGVTMMVMERMPEAPASLVAARMIADYCAPLRELAEIGRLAVECEKERSAWQAEYQSSNGKGGSVADLFGNWHRANVAHSVAVAAFLAKQPKGEA